jgi:hypothetical protein
MRLTWEEFWYPGHHQPIRWLIKVPFTAINPMELAVRGLAALRLFEAQGGKAPVSLRFQDKGGGPFYTFVLNKLPTTQAELDEWDAGAEELFRELRNARWTTHVWPFTHSGLHYDIPIRENDPGPARIEPDDGDFVYPPPKR